MAEYVVVDKEQLESDLGIVCDAIREKGGTSEQLAFPNGMADAVRVIESGGEDWTKYIIALNSAFMGVNFPQGYEMDLNVPNLQVENKSAKKVVMQSVFSYTTGIKRVKFIYNHNSEWTYNMGYSFRESADLEEVDFLWNEIKVQNIAFCFDKCKKLKVIKAHFDFSPHTSALNYVFTQCDSLEEVRVVANTVRLSLSFAQSSRLSDASIQSIIDGLADLTGQTAQTITWHPDVKARLTDEQKTQITNKNWILA